MSHTLDFSLLPSVSYGRAFMRLDDDVAAGVASLTRLSERASNAIRFAYWAGGTSEDLRCPEPEVQHLREGCFRAALTEFASMEDVQVLDYKDCGIARTPLKLNETSNPLLHLFRELRNLEVHLRHSELRSVQKNALWGHKDRPDEATKGIQEIWILDGVTPQSFGMLRNAKHYTSNQIDQMISWLNATQEQWGIQEVFLLAVEEYCRLIENELKRSGSD
ncbi:MAG: hypothetical protein ACYCZA_08420 [Thiobacillus sp.]